MNHMHNCPCCEPDALSIAITARNNIAAHIENTDVHLTEEERKWLDEFMAKSDDEIVSGCNCADELQKHLQWVKDNLDNDSNWTNIPSTYATVSWVTDQINNVKNTIVGDYATQNWVKSQGYLTQHQSLSGYATEAWVRSQIEDIDISGPVDLSNYYTKSEADAIFALKGEGGAGDGTGSISYRPETSGANTYPIGTLSQNGSKVADIYGKYTTVSITQSNTIKNAPASQKYAIGTLMVNGASTDVIYALSPSSVGGTTGGDPNTGVVFPDLTRFEMWYSDKKNETLDSIGNPGTHPWNWQSTIMKDCTWMAQKTTTLKYNTTAGEYLEAGSTWSVWRSRASIESIDWGDLELSIRDEINEKLAQWILLSAEDVLRILNGAEVILDMDGRVTSVESKVNDLVADNKMLSSKYASLEQKQNNLELSLDGIGDDVQNLSSKITLNQSIIEQTAKSITSVVGEWSAHNMLYPIDVSTTSNHWDNTGSYSVYSEWSNFREDNRVDDDSESAIACIGTAIVEIVIPKVPKGVSEIKYDIYLPVSTSELSEETGEWKVTTEYKKVKTIEFKELKDEDGNTIEKSQVAFVLIPSVNFRYRTTDKSNPCRIQITPYNNYARSVLLESYVGLYRLEDADKLSMIEQLSNRITLAVKEELKLAAITLGIVDEDGNPKESFITLLADKVDIAAKVTRIFGELIGGGNASFVGDVTAKSFRALNSDDLMSIALEANRFTFSNADGVVKAYFELSNDTIMLCFVADDGSTRYVDLSQLSVLNTTQYVWGNVIKLHKPGPRVSASTSSLVWNFLRNSCQSLAAAYNWGLDYLKGPDFFYISDYNSFFETTFEVTSQLTHTNDPNGRQYISCRAYGNYASTNKPSSEVTWLNGYWIEDVVYKTVVDGVTCYKFTVYEFNNGTSTPEPSYNV